MGKKEKTAAELLATPEGRAKQLKIAVKEGGAQGWQILGSSETSSREWFAVRIENSLGDPELLKATMDAMNAEVDPNEEEKKGGSKDIAKMIFSADEPRMAVVAYVPESKKDKLDPKIWLEHVLGKYKQGVVTSSTETIAEGHVPLDMDNNVFPLKIRDDCIASSVMFLMAKGLVPQSGDSDEGSDYVIGDDDL